VLDYQALYAILSYHVQVAIWNERGHLLDLCGSQSATFGLSLAALTAKHVLIWGIGKTEEGTDTH
jgi:hypothetical protein